MSPKYVAVHAFPLSGDGNCVAVHTAGFGDTREEERDIATAIALNMVVDSAPACRFAAVLNCHGWFEARAGARLLTDFNDMVQFEQCVDFVFAKCNALEIRMPPLEAATKEAVAERKIIFEAQATKAILAQLAKTDDNSGITDDEETVYRRIAQQLLFNDKPFFEPQI